MSLDCAAWNAPPDELRLDRREVHVWRARLDQPATAIHAFQSTLTPDEQQRANSFHFARDRNHFIVGRGVLRELLGRYLLVNPSELRFTYNRYGKPALDRKLHGEGLKFNLAHSGGLALYAFTRDGEVGIDVEQLREDLGGEEIARQFFSTEEVKALTALPEHLRTEGFFNCWTRKEAYIKAQGEGLSLSLQSFDVTLTPGEAALLLATRDDPHEASRWSMRALSPGAGYAAALVLEGAGDYRVECWQWPVVS